MGPIFSSQMTIILKRQNFMDNSNLLNSLMGNLLNYSKLKEKSRHLTLNFMIILIIKVNQIYFQIPSKLNRN